VDKLFSPFGKISSLQVLVDKATGKSRGVAFVHYERPEDAQAAINKLHLHQLEPNAVVRNYFVRFLVPVFRDLLHVLYYCCSH
jgi:RNA recognition motif-containing protein